MRGVFFMKKIKYLMLLLVFGFLMVGCGKKQQEGVVEEPTSGSTPLLLEVSKENTKNKLYLFGSIHASDESMYPLPDYVMDAYQKSDAIAVEFDLIEYTKDLSSQVSLLSKFVIPNNQQIGDYIEQEDYAQAVEILQNANLYSPVFDSYNPMFWVTLIENAAIVDAKLKEQYGIDHHFLQLAKEDSKEIMELESAEYQYNLLSGFDYDTQIHLLKQSIDQYEEQTNDLKELHELYKKGNKKELEELLFEEEEVDEYTEEYNHQLVTVRNGLMASSLKEAFDKGENIFCTVGLAHIIGEGGVADLLEQQGYTVKIVK